MLLKAAQVTFDCITGHFNILAIFCLLLSWTFNSSSRRIWNMGLPRLAKLGRIRLECSTVKSPFKLFFFFFLHPLCGSLLLPVPPAQQKSRVVHFPAVYSLDVNITAVDGVVHHVLLAPIVPVGVSSAKLTAGRKWSITGGGRADGVLF